MFFNAGWRSEAGASSVARYPDIRLSTEISVGMFVDYESPLARHVARDVWSGLSRAALDGGFTKSTALWKSLREERGFGRLQAPPLNVFIIGQDRPEDIDAVGAVGGSGLYGVVVGVPGKASPLAGSLLYQGVERLTQTGVRAGLVEPALLHARPAECGSYAQRLLERLLEIRKG